MNKDNRTKAQKMIDRYNNPATVYEEREVIRLWLIKNNVDFKGKSTQSSPNNGPQVSDRPDRVVFATVQPKSPPKASQSAQEAQKEIAKAARKIIEEAVRERLRPKPNNGQQRPVETSKNDDLMGCIAMIGYSIVWWLLFLAIDFLISIF